MSTINDLKQTMLKIDPYLFPILLQTLVLIFLQKNFYNDYDNVRVKIYLMVSLRF